MAEVLIGIQARSTSTRLPGKALEYVDRLTVTESVLDAGKSAVAYLNRKTTRSDIHAYVVLLIPYGDPLRGAMSGNLVLEGPEDDVLSRYIRAYKEFNPNYIVRLTGDCPLIAPSIISKHINIAVMDEKDYVSNVWEDMRTYVDGLDVEVISARALLWLDEQATEKTDREHVTTYLRKNPPSWLKVGTVLAHIDLGDIKLSVDTPEELETVRKNRVGLNKKIDLARKRGHSVYRF